MGHTSFVIDGDYLVLKDCDVELARHFLIQGAQLVASDEVVEDIRRWEWQGPGVWGGIEEQVLVENLGIIDSAITLARGAGAELSSGFLKNELQQRDGVIWGATIPTTIVIEALEKLRSFAESHA